MYARSEYRRYSLASQHVRGLSIATGTIAAVLISAFFIFDQSAKAGEAHTDAEPPNASEQIKVYTLGEASEFSRSPLKQIVFHYDSKIGNDEGNNSFYIDLINIQISSLRKSGFRAVAMAGGPSNSLQVIVDGRTAPSLVFDKLKLKAFATLDYAAAYYKKYIGNPSDKPIQADSLETNP